MTRNRSRARSATMPRVGMYLGSLTPVESTGHAGRRGRRPSAHKGAGLWRETPYYRTPISEDRRWSVTKSSQ